MQTLKTKQSPKAKDKTNRYKRDRATAEKIEHFNNQGWLGRLDRNVYLEGRDQVWISFELGFWGED